MVSMEKDGCEGYRRIKVVIGMGKLGIRYVHGVNGMGSGCSLSTSVAAVMFIESLMHNS